mmetsp:Transcript_4116/g.8905  ORF Transcript_4116/g.8905 Transcript_4116/m.8905 type:complete len:498 (-) Transcript_4116:140-1633(-)
MVDRNSTFTSTTPAPPQWTKEIADLYTPIRVIGKGGFASVWMAKCKNQNDNNNESNNQYVAIKVVGDSEYAQREVAILSELSARSPHPNIMRFIHDSRPDSKSSHQTEQHHCVVLSLARGPTLHHILQKNGALGLVMAQSISRQLIDAVAFLHGHAVLHRDIQPANLIISGSQVEDPLWWSDVLDIDGKVEEMARKCHVTLVDFGFARALCPDDIKNDLGLNKMAKEKDDLSIFNDKHGQTSIVERDIGGCINNALLDTSQNKSKRRGRSHTPRSEMEDSIGNHRVRDLSALGTRNYAAPEILSGIHKLADTLNTSIHKRILRSSSGESLESTKRTSSTTRTLGECVSDYGMVADAFSVGATLRHMVTGVPPNMDVEEFISAKNHPLKKLARSFKKRIGGSKAADRRKKVYRLEWELTEDVRNLIHILTHYDSRRRATVRFARKHEWIDRNPGGTTVMGKGGHEETLSLMEHGGPIVYLQCGMETNRESKNATVLSQ